MNDTKTPDKLPTLPAPGFAGPPRLTPEGATWHSMYLGAFIALDVPNVDMAMDLTECTRSDEEVYAAISAMRVATTGDRVWPALELLRLLRRRAQKESADSH